MNIHFFVRTLNDEKGGGSHYNSIAFIRGLREHGHTVVVHVFSGSGGNHFPDDIKPILHDGWGLSFLKSRSCLAKLLKQYEIDADAYFLYAVEFAWGGGLYRRQGGKVPVVVYMDAYLPSMNNVHLASFKEWAYHIKRIPWDKTIGLLDAHAVDQFLPCSPYIGEEYKKFGFPKDKFTVLPNIVPDKSVAKVAAGQGEPIQILYIGRLIYDKGIDLLIDALKSFAHIPWKLNVVGNGPMEKYVQDRIQKENLPIVLHGWIPQQEVGKFYAQADVFVHPARWPDPAPRTVVDALYAKLPMIVPDTGGSSWIAGKAGIVFKTGDVSALKAALVSFFEGKKEIAQNLTSYAEEEVKKFSEESVIAQLQSILNRVTRTSV